MIHGVGKLCLDNLMYVDHYPEKNSLVHIVRTKAVMGGMVANALKAADLFGEPTTLYSYVGRDDSGKALMDALGKTGINSDRLVLRENTDYSNIIVHGEIRTILSCRANGERKRTEDFSVSFRKGDVLIVDGTIREGLGSLLERAKKEGATTLMDVSPANLDRGIENLLPHMDYLIPSLDWARNFTGREEPDEMANRLLERGAFHLVMTDGGGPVRYYHSGETRLYYPRKIEVKNSNGAGDTFHGAFCFGLARGWNLHRIIQFSLSAATSRCLCEDIDQIPPLEEILQDSSLVSFSPPV